MLLGLASTLNRKFASKELILHAFGFSSSYEETLLFEASVLMHREEFKYSYTYLQTVGDNADHDTQTLSGHDTLHVMGRREILFFSIIAGTAILRLSKMPSAEVLGSFGKVDLQIFHKPSYSTLGKICVKDLQKDSVLNDNIEIKPADFLWFYGKHYKRLDFTGWNGFMEPITQDCDYVTSKTRILPFINNPASNYDKIYVYFTFRNRQEI